MAELVFSYKAKDSAGRNKAGAIKAPNRDRAFQILRSEGLSPISVTQRGESLLEKELSIPGFEPKAKTKALALFTKQFAFLIKAGMRISESIEICAAQTDDKVLKRGLEAVQEDLEKGMALSVAMRKHERAFPQLMTSIMAVAEEGGIIDKSLLSISNGYKRDLEIKQKVKSAMSYPVIVLVVALLVCTFMLIFIVPTFADMFESMDAELPTPTKVLVAISKNMLIIVPVFSSISVALYILYQKYKKEEWLISNRDRLKLNVPVFGKLQLKISISRFCRNLAMMTEAGVHLPVALKMVSDTANNWVISSAIDKIILQMEAGKTFSSAMEDFDVFPLMVKQMIIVGENTGELAPMLNTTADFYDDDIKEMSENLSNAIEPLMYLLIGGIIGGMLFALYMPMFNLMSVISEG